MAWLELSLRASAAQQPALEAALETLGALAVTLQDADAETPDEQAILEPGVGELPLWSSVVLSALFEHSRDRGDLLLQLKATVPELDATQCNFRMVEDQDWERAWMDQFQPMRFGRRVWIYPWNIEPPAAEDNVVVRLDPGLAFGTGTHPTTAMCLEWLDGANLCGKHVLDYGCGSGVLGIAACKLGAGHVLGIDNDPQALLASADNAARNAVADVCEWALPNEREIPNAHTDVLLANILAGPLASLAPTFAAISKPGAALVLSGILDGQQHELLDTYAAWFADFEVSQREGWIRIAAIRR